VNPQRHIGRLRWSQKPEFCDSSDRTQIYYHWHRHKFPRAIGVDLVVCLVDQDVSGIFHADRRGSPVDSSALTRVLKSGHLGGAALDVLDTEPRPAPELWEAPRLLLTPHVAAHSAERRANSERFSEEQLARFLKGEPLQQILDFVKGGLVS
jgi:hypothetical protein